MERIEVAGLKVARVLHDFVAHEALPGTGVDAPAFWSGLAALVRELGPRNRALLAARDALQAKIDGYHRARTGKPVDAADYERFLCEIGYLAPEPADFAIRTQNVDEEIATIAGLAL
jgi:malate synthase